MEGAQISLLEKARWLVKQKGIAGLYSGIEAKLIQTTVNSGLLLMFYERLVHEIRRLLTAPLARAALV
jgi:hypothetical protein